MLMPKQNSGKVKSKNDIAPRNIILINAICQTAFSARSGFLAPKFCPTKVEAALAIPQDGKNVKLIILIAIV